MKCYRIKHLPTGLYYRPSSHVQIKIGDNKTYVKTNLSKKGKIYPMKPCEAWFVGGIYNHVQREADLKAQGVTDVYRLGFHNLNKAYDSPKEVWEIEEL